MGRGGWRLRSWGHMLRAVIQIGQVLFDPSTGEIRATRPGGGSATRLPPQPARLLSFLIEKRGELATREEIKRLLWPETHVDFDQSMSFCVRQIRSAIRAAGGEQAYVETLPRRGYRLARPVSHVGDSLPVARRPSRRVLVNSALIAGLAGAAIAVVLLVASRERRPPPRLAIMPFELAVGDAAPAADPDLGDELAGVSERLLAEAGRCWTERLEVVGPRSTAAYSSLPFPDLRALGRDLDIDYVLNARFLEREGEAQLVVELIRHSDGAHPWVRFFPRADDTGIVAATLSGIADALRLPAC